MSVVDADAVVVGAGVIGLAIAAELARSGRSVIVLETEGGIGTGTSSRNSEVIHAGLYYPTGSLKARLCVEGRRRLYDFCAERGVPHHKLGKLIVACDEAESVAFDALLARGLANGVEGLGRLSAAQVKSLEPEIICVGALLSAETGILDAHAYMLALLGEANDYGALVAFRTPFVGAHGEGPHLVVETGGAEPWRLRTHVLVNAAGLAASDVARLIEGLDLDKIPTTRLAKGNYFSLIGRTPFRRLIYPAPQTHGLGVHLTLDMAGRARFGPDVEWIEGINYDVDERRGVGFYNAIRRYWPALPSDALAPAYSGIRPKIGGPDDPAADFRIDVLRVGDASVVNLYGIESPGLTSSLALAVDVVNSLPN